MLEIFRVYYNYFLAGKDKMTPAMRLGLAQAIVDPKDILYISPRKKPYLMDAAIRIILLWHLGVVITNRRNLSIHKI